MELTEELYVACDPWNEKLCEACDPPHGTSARYDLGDGERYANGDRKSCTCEPCKEQHALREAWLRYEMQETAEPPGPRPWEPEPLASDWKRFGLCRPGGKVIDCPSGHFQTQAKCKLCFGTGKTTIRTLFFPTRGQSMQYAKALCDDCPVRRECLLWGAHYEDYGIWGGTGEAERVEFRREFKVRRQNLVEVFTGV